MGFNILSFKIKRSISVTTNHGDYTVYENGVVEYYDDAFRDFRRIDPYDFEDGEVEQLIESALAILNKGAK